MKIPGYISESGVISIFLLMIINSPAVPLQIITNHLIAVIIIYTAMRVVSSIAKQTTNRTLLGQGDAKLASLGGAWLGIEGGFIAISIAFMTAAIFSLAGRITSKLKPWQPFPFAPFIGIGIDIVWNIGKEF